MAFPVVVTAPTLNNVWCAQGAAELHASQLRKQWSQERSNLVIS